LSDILQEDSRATREFDRNVVEIIDRYPSFRDVEDLLAERAIMVSYETVRRWVNHFGPKIAADLRKCRPKPQWPWSICGAPSTPRAKSSMWLKLMRKLLKNYAVVPEKLVADDLRSYGAADGLSNRHERGRWRNNRAENSHQPAAACQKPNRLPLELACILTTLPIRSLKS
jgi:transposase-like protein